MTHIKPEPISQAAVELATGLSREVLRKWELRYQFPLPSRGERGQRLYTHDDVQRLNHIKRLLKHGLRPAKLVSLSLASLQELLDAHAHLTPLTSPEAAVPALLACLTPQAAPRAALAYLEHLVQQDGLTHLVDQLLPAFNQAVGQAWAEGCLGVYAEHYYTETVRHVVLRALPSQPLTPRPPRVLLTTPPGELHGLGLLALQASLALQGADCFSLGTQTPVPDVVRAVHDLGIQVVAISASICLPPDSVQAYVQALRQQLPCDCWLWLGGQGCESLADQTTANFQVFQTTQQAVQAWLRLAKQAPVKP